jgi:hypothetical protein
MLKRLVFYDGMAIKVYDLLLAAGYDVYFSYHPWWGYEVIIALTTKKA